MREANPPLALQLSASSSCGAVASALIDRQLRQLVALQSDVLVDREPEALHQMRIHFRRLRGGLEQFAPALLLPEAADPDRVARISRRLGYTRDLDVLRQRLEQELMPQLPERELQQLKPLFKQLRRERRLAFEDLRECLQGRRYLKLLAKLQDWLRQPRVTGLGEQPVQLWRSELQQAVVHGLTSLPGWWVEGPYGEGAHQELHRLRRRIKRARYGLSNLEFLDPAGIRPWLERLRELQHLLGDLGDLQLITDALERELDGATDQVLPGLCSVLMEQRSQAWQRWWERAALLREPHGRSELHRLTFSP